MVKLRGSLFGLVILSSTVFAQANPWPGSAPVPADTADELGGNLSGLAGSETGELWAVRDMPSELVQLERVGGAWSFASEWGAPRALRYADGQGSPDAEGVTAGPIGRVYVAAERSNDAPGVSRNTILEYDSSQPSPLMATQQWELGDLVPSSSANGGLEALAWLPSTVVTSGPAVSGSSRPSVDGFFAAGSEADGNIRILRLLDEGAVELVGTVETDLEAVMSLAWVDSRQELWALCDATCGAQIAVIVPSEAGIELAGSLTLPPELAALNLEGVATDARCDADNSLGIQWADDNATDGHAIREASLDCDPAANIAAEQQPVVADAAGSSTPPEDQSRTRVVVLASALLVATILLGALARRASLRS